MSDPISDMLTRIRNAGSALIPSIELPHSKLKESVAHILKKEGYIAEVAVEGDKIKKLKLKLKYENRRPVIAGLRRISAPGMREYKGATKVPRVLGGLGVAIVSTSQGVMTGYQARKANVGGEVLCYVW